MSLLPQRKKSAEEIAKLRETLGIPDPSQGEPELPVAAPPEKQGAAISESPAHEENMNSTPLHPLASHGHGGRNAERATASLSQSQSASRMAAGNPLPLESSSAPSPKFQSAPETAPQLHDAKSARTEKIPVLPCEESGPPPTAVVHLPPPEELPSPLPAEQPATRIVRSLRKSEQGPVFAPPPPAPDSKLPVYRHSDQELNEIRRRETLAMIGTPILPQTHTAHLALVIPGYIFALIGGLAVAIPDNSNKILEHFGIYWIEIENYSYDFEKILTAICASLALAIAAFIYFRKPFSRHHAAFIGTITLFVIIFGALHFFPQLRHGT